jgi:hypothetical protein
LIINIFLRCFSLFIEIKDYLQILKYLIDLAELCGPAFDLRDLFKELFS